MKIDVDLKLNINRLVQYFIFADLIFLAGWGLFDPIFAIFVVQKIEAATITTVGLLVGVYWIVKSLVQIPVSLFLDKIEGEKDDFYTLIIGLLVAAIALFSFMAATKIWHVYTIQVIKAIAFALYLPSWRAIFSRHLDKGKIAFEWALSSTSVGLSMGLMAIVGGVIAGFSFNSIFLFGGLFSLSSALILLFMPDLVLPRHKRVNEEIALIDHGPGDIQK
ncbi:MAG: MFS transporter [Proteobacteria bacterium]|nr:MFS transporter [Pseudomonadota bacterium]MBU4348605.1 MFS transporter [Patescibacteria group bacterium]